MRDPILAAVVALTLTASTVQAQTPPIPSAITQETTPKVSTAPAPPRQPTATAGARRASHSGEARGIIIVSGRGARQHLGASRTAPVALNPQPLPPDPPPIEAH